MTVPLILDADSGIASACGACAAAITGDTIWAPVAGALVGLALRQVWRALPGLLERARRPATSSPAVRVADPADR